MRGPSAVTLSRDLSLIYIRFHFLEDLQEAYFSSGAKTRAQLLLVAHSLLYIYKCGDTMAALKRKGYNG